MIQVRVYIETFCGIIFSYSFTAIQTLTFGYIKWAPYVALTINFLDTVSGQYFRQDMGKNLILNTQNDSVIASFSQKYCLSCRVPLVKMRGWSVKSRFLQDTILYFIDIIYRNYNRSNDTCIFSLPKCRWNLYIYVFDLVVTNWQMQTLQVLFNNSLRHKIKRNRIMWLR